MEPESNTPFERTSRPGWLTAAKDFRAILGRAAVTLESASFFVLFMYLALDISADFFGWLPARVLGQSSPFDVMALLPALLRDPGSVAPDTTALHAISLFGATVVRPLLLITFNVTCATFIAIRSTGVRYHPTTLREIVIPLMGTFVMVLLSLSLQLGWFGRPFELPDTYMVPLFATGTLLFLAGGAFAVYALMYLKRNFSIFVEVRTVVLEGPYRYVRHPMYLGEIIMIAGLVLTILSPFSISLLACLVLFQYMRARMEQTRLCEASPEYAEHVGSSGMFFPKV